MKSLLLITLLLVVSSFAGHSQNVAINTADTAAHPSAGLDVNFSNKGILIPRVYLTSISDTTTIPTPANSLMVYNTNPAVVNGSGVGYYFYCAVGCTTKGWKFINFSENNSGGGSEWKYYSKRTFTNTMADQDFTTLPSHDKWKLVFDVHGDNLSLIMRINNVAYTYYGTSLTSGSDGVGNYGYANYWYLFSGSYSSAMSGEVILTGKPTTSLNSKTFTATLGCNIMFGYRMASYGFLNNDPNNINSIKISMFQSGSMTGRIELWYKDNQ